MFLWKSLGFFYDPVDVGNLISGSSAFSKSSFYILKFSVHLLLKPSLKDFEHYFASMWNECNCAVVWTFFGIGFCRIGMKTDLSLTLQYCIGFAIYRNESATGIHVFPILNPPPSSLPIPSLWVVPVYQPQASSIVHRTWTGDSFHIWHYMYFNAILPNHPTLSLSHRVQKTVLYISVSFAVSYTGLLLPSF